MSSTCRAVRVFRSFERAVTASELVIGMGSEERKLSDLPPHSGPRPRHRRRRTGGERSGHR
jgi:hypothetical protein